MNAQIDLVHMLERLISQQKVLTEQIEMEKKKVMPSPSTNQNQVDLAYDHTYRNRHSSLLENLEGRLKSVNGALKRLEEGTYGLCTNCGKVILPERLEALPDAALCMDCQRKEENEHAF
ncbi:MAG: hypothetical protein C3F07_15950 [Anaerolineales bacterium]|nr:hypothetical protein [Anaerolineae bacterium]PWB70767.1 MAG: hypothetical protein C3F07_15950 [Anaerolineales bacterium]